MALFNVPVAEYMSSPVQSVKPDASLPVVQHRMASLGLSSLAVIDGDRLVGTVSRTDLLAVGQRQTANRGRSPLLVLPNRAVSEVMSPEPIAVDPEHTIAAAAALMHQYGIHRVFAARGDRALGVLSTHDLMVATSHVRPEQVIRDWMSAPVVTIEASLSIALATRRIENAHVSGLVVVENNWPVGLFTQIEALECRDLPRETAIDEVMNPGMICLPEETRIWRAAQQATAMGARRVIAVKQREMSGILGGLDFARIVAQAA